MTSRADRHPAARKAADVDIRDEGREALVWVRIAQQMDAAEYAIMTCGVGQSAARMLMATEGCTHITRKHANRLLYAAQLRWREEGKKTSRELRKELARKRAEQLYRMALEKRRAVVLTVGEDLQEVEYVDDPDLKAAALALGKLIELDGLAEAVADELKTPEGARATALAAYAKAYGAPALPAPSEDG